MTSAMDPPQFDVVLRGFDRAQVVRLIDRANAAFVPLTGAPVFSQNNPDVPPITSRELSNAPVDTVLRGYDRAQVRAFLTELTDHLAEAESRAG